MYTYSFIIPHHNSPELLNRCLDSIPQREDIQIIVVDDNSKPEKRPKISRTDVEVLYIDAEHTKGAGHARNVGMEKAKGKWLLFADCDDYYCDDFINVLDKHIDREIDVLYFNYNKQDELGNIIQKQYIVQTVLEKGATDKSQEDCVRFKNNAPWNKMVKRNFIDEKNIKFEETPNGNDLLYSLKLGLFSDNYYFISDRLYYYIIQSNSLTRGSQSVDDIVCRLEHYVKKQEFYKRIGHKEWNDNLIRLFYQAVAGCNFIEIIKIIVKCFIRFVIGVFSPKQWATMVKMY